VRTVAFRIFDQDGKFIDQWKQFGRPSGVYIDKNDTIYVADSQSNATQNRGFKRGIYIGSAKDGKVTAMIPFVEPDPDKNKQRRHGRSYGRCGGQRLRRGNHDHDVEEIRQGQVMTSAPGTAVKIAPNNPVFDLPVIVGIDEGCSPKRDST